MATLSERRLLIWDLQKKLPALNANQLQTLASAVDDGQGEKPVDTSSFAEPELYDFIIDFAKSEKLKSLEDEGLSRLLFLNEAIDDLLTNNDSTPAPPGSALPAQGGDSASTPLEDITLTQPGDASPATHTGTSTTSRDSGIPVMDRGATITRDCVTKRRGATKPSTVSDQVVRLTDVTTLLPRREFKLFGGQLSDSGSELSYNSICKQIDEGLQEGFTESEVIRTVIKITKPGTFREMLTNKDDLTVDELKRFLKSHIREKSSSELFQELSSARQQDKETPQQFMYRLMGLKQRVLVASQQSGSEFSYDKKLVQGTFLHTLYQGLNEKNTQIRSDLKPYATDFQVTDDVLLEQITKSTNEEAERLKRLGTVTKARPVTASSALQGDTDQAGCSKLNTRDKEEDNHTAILALTAQVSALTKHLEKMSQTPDSEAEGGTYQTPTNTRQAQGVNTKGRCHECVNQRRASCFHCFSCGQEGHRAVGCLKKKRQGNETWSLGRGTQ